MYVNRFATRHPQAAPSSCVRDFDSSFSPTCLLATGRDGYKGARTLVSTTMQDTGGHTVPSHRATLSISNMESLDIEVGGLGGRFPTSEAFRVYNQPMISRRSYDSSIIIRIVDYSKTAFLFCIDSTTVELRYNSMHDVAMRSLLPHMECKHVLRMMVHGFAAAYTSG